MNILQLLTSLNDDKSIRAIAAYSKILKDNNYRSYVFAPLGRIIVLSDKLKLDKALPQKILFTPKQQLEKFVKL